MKIESTLKNSLGQTLDIVYYEGIDPMQDLEGKILQGLLGFQDIYEPERIIRQTRSFCIVEPYGNFIADPDGEITEIKLIDPIDYKQYFDWGKIGERIMGRAKELEEKFLNQHEVTN